jgi:hypothetical protein
MPRDLSDAAVFFRAPRWLRPDTGSAFPLL